MDSTLGCICIHGRLCDICNSGSWEVDLVKANLQLEYVDRRKGNTLDEARCIEVHREPVRARFSIADGH